MVFSKKYRPIWVCVCGVLQLVTVFILWGVDLTQSCRKFANGLSGLFEEVWLKELVRTSELIVQFLVEERINENSTDLLSSLSSSRFYYARKKTRWKFGGVFGVKLSDGVRKYSGNETLKNLEAYYYETLSKATIAGNPSRSLATQTGLLDLQEIARNAGFQVDSKTYRQHY